TWLVLAGGGLFIAMAAIAAWQFSARRDPAASEQATAASAPASSVVITTPAVVPAAAAPVIVDAARAAIGSTLAREPVPTVPTSSIVANDTAARATSVERAPMADGLSAAASAARVRPPGKPVPRVGEDPALAASTGNGTTTRAIEYPSPSSPGASGNGERSRLSGAAPPRDYPAVQRPTSPVMESAAESLRELCGKGAFVSRAVCMDERCEEARFHSLPECAEVLARKNRRGQQ
ncbi:MAG: hypothetical protein M3Z15_05940, partial [Pseudomonadota bacterium]|nr:hypothetical protein [Pseudomonadota bacterium]